MGIVQTYAEILDDPTRPPGYAKPYQFKGMQKQKASWKLSAIKIDAYTQRAIINDKTVAEGNKVDGALVMEILPNQVKLRNEKGEFSVRLVKQKVKVRQMPVVLQDIE